MTAIRTRDTSAEPADECAAIIEIAGKLDPALTAEEERSQLERLIAMLIRLTRSCES